MANVLSSDKQIAAIGALVEGASIRSVERMTGIHRDTIMRLGVRVGEACRTMLDEKMRELPCEKLEVDELWGYVGKKQRQVTSEDDPSVGDVWTFVAIDPKSKAVPVFRVGKRSQADTSAFIADIASRTINPLKLSSDGLNFYPVAVEQAFGGDISFGTIVKSYRASETEGRYSPPDIESVKRTIISGEKFRVSTSIVERQNLTMRMHMRRLTRLTNAFSKKLENFRAAVALHFAYYNFVKTHSTIRCTPAMALGVSSRLWKVADLVELSD